MNRFQGHINQLKALLQELQENLQPWLGDALLQEKKAQLKSVEKSIQQLQKSEVSIPDPLRDLKLKLLQEIDNCEEAQEAHKQLIAILQPHIPPQEEKPRKKRRKKRSRKQTRSTPSTSASVSDLLGVKLLTPGATLFCEYKGQRFEAIIQPDGQLQLTLNGRTRLYNTPSAAAVAATNKSQNGWTFWNIRREDGIVTLDFYRQKYKEHETQTGR